MKNIACEIDIEWIKMYAEQDDRNEINKKNKNTNEKKATKTKAKATTTQNNNENTKCIAIEMYVL